MSHFSCRKKPEKPQRIMILAGGFLGDTFWAVQVIPILQKAYPEAEIHVAGRPFIRDLAYGLLPERCLHEVEVIRDRTRENVSWSALTRSAADLKAQIHPDLVIDLMGNRYSAFFCWKFGVYCIGSNLAEEVSPLYSETVDLKKSAKPHLAGRPQTIINGLLGVNADFVPPAPPRFRYSYEEIMDRWNLSSSCRYHLFFPGAGWNAKRWNTEGFRTLAKRMTENGDCVLVCGTEDELEPLCKPVAEGIPGVRAIAAPLAEVISFLPHAASCIGCDSGLVHLAAALGLPVVALYCQTNPDYCGPIGRNVKVLQPDCPFLPKGTHFCQNHVALDCPRKERMNISAETVLQALTEIAGKI